MDQDPGSAADREDAPLVDAESLLSLTEQLRTLQATIEDADVSDEQRQRWLRTLGAIAQGAADDLERAAGQLRRLAAQVERGTES